MPKIDWSTLSPLPRVSPWSRGKPSYTWAQRGADYASLEKSPVIVTAELATPIVMAENDGTHLDGILSAAALTDHPHPSAWDGAAVVPLPLELAWVSPSGKPLWAATPLIPSGTAIAAREYWHKRYPTHRAEFGTRQNAVTSAGRYREYRVPINAISIDRLHALAIGHPGEMQRLLDTVSHIGKKGSIGYGRVARWTLTPAAHTIADILALRAVPAEFASTGRPVEPLRGWTPPYWYAPWWDACEVPG